MLLNRCNIFSMSLQSSSLDLKNAVALLESMCEYVATLREQFISLKIMARRRVDALNTRKTQAGNECAVSN